VKLLGRRGNDAGNDDADPQVPPEPEPAGPTARTTAPKGRPTPKRTDKRRGPVAPAPLTSAEARKRRKELRSSMTREERRADKAERRAALSQRRERMMAGEEAFLLPRDRGPVRRYARDLVDSRRNLLGLFMPAALVLIVISLALPQVQYYFSPLMLVFLAAMVIDAVLLGRKVNRAVDEKFPDNTETNFKLGVYAAGRASQMRRMRIPKPQVRPGEKVA
jgi:hypothetical protein